ncbi:uncharacterized protein LOC113106744 [Carassius auratus]|uniref:Uncharacterized protein LOC113106744 n=1 Tax=Carassius auratus TaxID=7957 RepID=A0A6P6PTX5_CARAU|nr:uncharacterized protein LOC113106744 [Carassius auratus]
MSIKLLDQERMWEIWRTQQRHMQFIQDSPGVQLYRKTGQLTKDGVILPVYRCARGSTSLESFHLHLNRFVPGTSANALHFQMDLLEGLVQWNEARGVAAVEGASREEICYGGQLLQYCNVLSQQLLGLKLPQDYTSPGEFKGELFGLEYLYSQTRRAFEEDLGVDPDIPDVIQGSPLGNRQHPYNLLISPHQHQHQHQLSLTLLPCPLRARWRVWDQMAKLVMTTSLGWLTVWLTCAFRGLSLRVRWMRLLCCGTTLQQDIEPFTAPLVAPEQLPPVLPKLPEAIQHGHSSFEFEIPQDASGQAAPRSRGQLPPVGLTPAPQVPSATSAIPASASVPAATHKSTTASAMPIPVEGAPVPVAAADEKRVPRTKAWRRKKLAEAAAAQGLNPKKRQIAQQFLCQKCGQPKTEEFGHSQFRCVHFCAKASGKTVAQWMEEVKRGKTK